MTTPDLWASAVHEAGHACLSAMYRFPVAVVSIQRGRTHSGVTIRDPEPADPRELVGGRPVLDVDPVARQWADRRLLVVLAGDAAEAAFGPRATGYRPDPPRYDLPTLPRLLEPILAARLADAQARIGMTDDELAFEMAYRLVGLTANAYLVWARSEARQLVDAHAPAIHAVATALMASPTHTLDGPSAVEIIEAEETHIQHPPTPENDPERPKGTQ